MEFYISLIFHHLTYSSKIQNEIAFVSDKTTPFARYRNCKGISIPNFSFQPLLESINADYLLLIIRLLLLERKVILIRDNFNNNAIIIEGILMLIYPL